MIHGKSEESLKIAIKLLNSKYEEHSVELLSEEMQKKYAPIYILKLEESFDKDSIREINEELNKRVLLDAEAFVEVFSKEELLELSQFFESELGKKYVYLRDTLIRRYQNSYASESTDMEAQIEAQEVEINRKKDRRKAFENSLRKNNYSNEEGKILYETYTDLMFEADGEEFDSPAYNLKMEKAENFYQKNKTKIEAFKKVQNEGFKSRLDSQIKTYIENENKEVKLQGDGILSRRRKMQFKYLELLRAAQNEAPGSEKYLEKMKEAIEFHQKYTVFLKDNKLEQK